MRCPQCGKPSHVTDSRQRDGGVWRRRRCFNEHVFYTTEMEAEMLSAANLLLDRVAEQLRNAPGA